MWTGNRGKRKDRGESEWRGLLRLSYLIFLFSYWRAKIVETSIVPNCSLGWAPEDGRKRGHSKEMCVEQH